MSTAQASIIFLLLLSTMGHEVETLEPVTTGIAVGTALFGSAFFATYDSIKCKIYECCSEPWVKPNITGLQNTLEREVHGQHLVLETVVKSIKGHVFNKQPSKALVLSFHGWTGSGKNFVSGIIARHLYDMGMHSRYVHTFVGSLHFAHESRVAEYKDNIQAWIRGNVSECARSLFIFDEMDKMPSGVIDALKPFLDHHQMIDGVDYRKTIFLFLSNTGGNDITQFTFNHWQNAGKREDIRLNDIEQLILPGAFNEMGGLWHSTLIEKHLITAFIPFLPMERKHIKLCIRDDLRAKKLAVTEQRLDMIADELTYWPADTKVFSKSGCRKVSEKVDLLMEEL